MTESLLTIDQLAERLSTSPRHVRRLIAEHRIPYLKVGALIRFDPSEIAGWMEEQRRPARPAVDLAARTRTRASVRSSRR